MQKLNTVGFIPPKDFPAKGHNNIHKCINEYKDTHDGQNDLLKAQRSSFRLGWNGLAYRYRAMAEYDEQFTTYIKEFGNSPPPEERYQQGRAFFGFFANAVSVIDCFFYSMYYIASILKPYAFPLPKSEKSIFYPTSVASKFSEHFPSDKLTKQMNKCLNTNNYKRMKKCAMCLVIVVCHHINFTQAESAMEWRPCQSTLKPQVTSGNSTFRWMSRPQ